ncbi:MAG: helix-turn-helix transcriptional regulator [Proteobacteria bacterium]|nr:helix-turn-helix transcriptional regulator [Pseudomonadota bacterium]
MMLGPRTLQRRLQAQKFTFRQLVDKVRKENALHYLQQTDLTMGQIAYGLGYSELSAFTRAFKRWFGVSPSKWRDQ